MTGHSFSTANATVMKSEIQYHVLGTSGKCYTIAKIIQSGNQMFFVVEDNLWDNCKDADVESPPNSPARNVSFLDSEQDATSDQENVQSSEPLTTNLSTSRPAEATVCLNVRASPNKMSIQQAFDRRLLAGPVTISKVQLSEPVTEIGHDEFIEEDTLSDRAQEDTGSNQVQVAEEIFDADSSGLPDHGSAEFHQNPEDGFSGNKLVHATTREVMDIKPLIEFMVKAQDGQEDCVFMQTNSEPIALVAIKEEQLQDLVERDVEDDESLWESTEQEQPKKKQKTESKTSTKKKSPSKEYPCQFCGKVLSTRQGSVVHERICKGDKPFACDICGTKFAHKAYLVTHYNSHIEGKPFACDVCGKRFKNGRNLASHRASKHENRYKHKCEYCGLTLMNTAKYTEHIRVHTGEKPWECSICGAAFAQSSSLNKHKRTHGKDYEYVCKLCPDVVHKFRYTSSLRRHMRKLHPHHIAAFDAGIMENMGYATVLSPGMTTLITAPDCTPTVHSQENM